MWFLASDLSCSSYGLLVGIDYTKIEAHRSGTNACLLFVCFESTNISLFLMGVNPSPLYIGKLTLRFNLSFMDIQPNHSNKPLYPGLRKKKESLDSFVLGLSFCSKKKLRLLARLNACSSHLLLYGLCVTFYHTSGTSC